MTSNLHIHSFSIFCSPFYSHSISYSFWICFLSVFLIVILFSIIFLWLYARNLSSKSKSPKADFFGFGTGKVLSLVEYYQNNRKPIDGFIGRIIVIVTVSIQCKTFDVYIFCSLVHKHLICCDDKPSSNAIMRRKQSTNLCSCKLRKSTVLFDLKADGWISVTSFSLCYLAFNAHIVWRLFCEFEMNWNFQTFVVNK